MADPLEFANMIKTTPTWAKPELVRLGKIGNVAGTNTINNTGSNVNVKS